MKVGTCPPAFALALALALALARAQLVRGRDGICNT